MKNPITGLYAILIAIGGTVGLTMLSIWLSPCGC